ncbi:hypothetical protein HD554DRAFT_2035218 [Boletus coccyginus]|nr:hypothetical protein HD554DRAFT_2035218 [Boletus coccyginus]
MAPLSDTADEGNPYAEVIEKYSEEQAADALFAKTFDDKPSLHVILPTFGWKFSDGTYIGRDPSGSFHFHNVEDFPDSECKYEVGTKTHKDGQVWVNVKFYAPDGSVFGEFVAHDKNKTVENANMQEAKGKGKWANVSNSNLPAYASKPKGGSTLTVIVGTIWRKAEINVDQYIYLREGDSAVDEYKDLKAHELAVYGRLVTEDADTLTNEDEGQRWVRWDFDHLVFYKDDWMGKDYTAYLMLTHWVLLVNENVDPSMTALGKVAKVIEGVKWTDLKEKTERAAAKELFKPKKKK